MRYKPQRPQAIIEAEKDIIKFFISLDADKFNDKARNKWNTKPTSDTIRLKHNEYQEKKEIK